MRQKLLRVLGTSLLAMGFGCGNEADGTNSGIGGVSTSGAPTNTVGGNVIASGGRIGDGGTETSRGAGSAEGGASSVASGGSNATNGGTSRGGAAGSGGASLAGALGIGGNVPTGGTVARGGSIGRGGASIGGASVEIGGAEGGSPQATGGAAPAAGGTEGGTTQAVGGTTPAIGGTPEEGGETGRGGAPNTGGGPSEWPQCFGTDVVPTTPLEQRAPSGDYATQVARGGVAMLIGPNRQSCLTDDVVAFDVEDLNQELKDVVETVQFYGFLDWKRGYYMNWVILNSGIPGATIANQGGHQGDRWGHMNFESSEECPCNWGTGDDSNRGAALHESIHALQSELWAFNNEASGWIHEAHNCYTATMRAYLGEGKATEGWGTALTLQMPHGPIESMGMNTDGTWAGPSDQNAKTYVNSINRYGLEIFWLVVNLEMGQGFINCIWESASQDGDPDNRRSGQLSVFQAMQRASSEEAIAHVIQNFGARSAILDFAEWTAAMRNNMRSNWNQDYWFYTFPNGDGTTTFSPPLENLPHHQGRNIIPIEVASGATSVTVEFTPEATGSEGTEAHLLAQMVYRDTSDNPVYGAIFSDGQCSIDIPDGARNDIVNLVVAVTNPNAPSGGDDGSNKGFDAQETFNYEARIVSGGTIAPTSTVPW